MADSWTDRIVLKLVNILTYFTFLGSNMYAVMYRTSNDYTGKETYITPAPWSFFIWYPIHILFLGTIVYQFFPRGKKIIVDGISWHFFILGIENIAYVSFWATHSYISAVILALCVSSTVTSIYYILKKHHVSESWADTLFVHVPFSLYHGWAAFLVTLSLFEAFGINSLTESAGIWTKLWVFLCLFSLHATTATYTFSTSEGDIPGALTTSWVLWAIYAHQKSSGFVHTTSLVFAILALIWVLMGALWFSGTRNRTGTDEERAPLVSS